MSKKVIVTGASSGFGKLTVEALLGNGHTVAATLRDADGRNKEAATELSNAGANIIEMDVTQTDSVNAGVAKAIEVMGGLDVVVNNAGRGVAGMQEHFTDEDFQKVFDINVFGVQRVNRAALPFLRKQGSGLLVHVSSLLGRITLPFYGPYNATKWAVEAMAENYRVELSGFGVESVLVEPGGFPTNFGTSLMTPSDDSQAESYGDFMNAPAASAEGFAETMKNFPDQKPEKVAEAILNLVETPTADRPFRTIVDFMPWRDGIEQYNGAMKELTEGIYTAFGMGDMLKVKS